MSGHSKWSTIKRKKAKEDGKRAKIFTKLLREITVVARQGGDPTGNPRLRTLLEKARLVNLPHDNISRAIKKGTGELQGAHYEEFTYEGYGPFGTAVMVDTLSDNKNRTVADLRRYFSNHGGNLAETNAVSWMFEKLGVIRGQTTLSEEKLLDALLAHDLRDMTVEDGAVALYADPKALEVIKNAVAALGVTIESAELEWVPKDALGLSEEQAEQAYAFLEKLDDLDDVQNVYTNIT